jgi:hypothetical protein
MFRGAKIATQISRERANIHQEGLIGRESWCRCILCEKGWGFLSYFSNLLFNATLYFYEIERRGCKAFDMHARIDILDIYKGKNTDQEKIYYTIFYDTQVHLHMCWKDGATLNSS